MSPEKQRAADHVSPQVRTGLSTDDDEIRRLSTELTSAKDEIRRLQGGQAPENPDGEWLRQAREYEYYWASAFKKIDVRQIAPFGPLAAKIIGHGRTYLGFDRLYTLWQLVETLPPAARAIAEVGAYRGGSARFVAEALRLHARELPFFVCDTFQGHVAVDEAVDGLHRPGVQFLRANAQKVAQYLAKFEFTRVLQGDIRETASTLADEHGFGLVHVDVDVYPITGFSLEFFGPRVVPGGTILVDDYGTTTCQGVKKAVDEFASSHAEYRLLHLLTGQALLTNLPLPR